MTFVINFTDKNHYGQFISEGSFGDKPDKVFKALILVGILVDLTGPAILIQAFFAFLAGQPTRDRIRIIGLAVHPLLRSAGPQIPTRDQGVQGLDPGDVQTHLIQRHADLFQSQDVHL